MTYLFMSSPVVSGSATAVVVKTGMATEYGKIAERLTARPPETEFERGLKQFSYLDHPDHLPPGHLRFFHQYPV